MQCKPEVNPDDWKRVHPYLRLMRDFTDEWCSKRGIPCLVTSIIRPRIPNVSKTDIHAHGRAFDLSIHGWTTDDIDEFLVDFKRKFINIGAFSINTYQSTPVVFEDGITKGRGAHLHCQCRP